MPRLLAAAVLPLFLVLAALAGCGGVLRAGGQYSGVPDTTVGDWARPMGTLSTSGRIDLFRERGWQ